MFDDNWYTDISKDKEKEPKMRNVPEDQKVWTFDHYFLSHPVQCGTVEYKIIDRVDVAVFTPLKENDIFGPFDTLAQWIYKTEDEAIDGKIEYLKTQIDYHAARTKELETLKTELEKMKNGK